MCLPSALIPNGSLVPLRARPLLAAAMGNADAPAFMSWWSTRGETVLVVGGTGSIGQITVQVVRRRKRWWTCEQDERVRLRRSRQSCSVASRSPCRIRLPPRVAAREAADHGVAVERTRYRRPELRDADLLAPRAAQRMASASRSTAREVRHPMTHEK